MLVSDNHFSHNSLANILPMNYLISNLKELRLLQILNSHWQNDLSVVINNKSQKEVKKFWWTPLIKLYSALWWTILHRQEIWGVRRKVKVKGTLTALRKACLCHLFILGKMTTCLKTNNKKPEQTYALSPSLNSCNTTSKTVHFLAEGSTSRAKHFKSKTLYSSDSFMSYCFTSSRIAREETTAEARAFKSVLLSARRVLFSFNFGCRRLLIT